MPGLMVDRELKVLHINKKEIENRDDMQRAKEY